MSNASADTQRLNLLYLQQVQRDGLKDRARACSYYGISLEVLDRIIEMSTTEVERIAASDQPLFTCNASVATLEKLTAVDSCQARTVLLALAEQP